MAEGRYKDDEGETRFRDDEDTPPRHSVDSVNSVSTISAVLEHIHDGDQDNGSANGNGIEMKQRLPLIKSSDKDYDEEEIYTKPREQPASRTTRIVLLSMCALSLAGWLLALFLFLQAGTYQSTTSRPHNPHATVSVGSGKPVTFDQVQTGQWYPLTQKVEWIKGAAGEDGLIMKQDAGNPTGYLIVEDVRTMKGDSAAHAPRVLMKDTTFEVDGKLRLPGEVYPSADLEKVLVMTDRQSNWRHSSTGLYWIFDVKTQTAQALDPRNPSGRIQLATWAPTSDSIVFTRDNNMYLRKLKDQSISRITKDGGPDLFYGVPDWVYEEEVFGGSSTTWWSQAGDYIAFLRTNETEVPEYPVQYFASRPSGDKPEPGLENYPEVRQIKYPKAGAPNPTVNLQFYDVDRGEVFDVAVDGDYADDDRLITEVVWAGKDGKVLVRETNRISNTLKVVLIDTKGRSGKTVRQVDVDALDGGWFEVSEYTKFVPADPTHGREQDGYIDTVIHDGYDHLAYFTPLDNPIPVYLTTGKWEVVDAPSSIDLKNNIVYFVATKKGPLHRHVYSVKLDGTDMKTVTDDSEDGYYEASFSTESGYALLTYGGPHIPNQKITSTASHDGSDFDLTLEDNEDLAKKAAEHELPILMYSTVEVDDVELNVIERRPPHFDEKKKYPVVFFLYNGPASHQVDKRFKVDFQSYLASNLGYIVVTVDGRGTGFQGRAFRTIVRGNIGHYEAHDQIATAKIWSAKKYVDAERMAIWGWSYGGYMTLKTLEVDAGQTFKYGMAVAPVTDWRYYDSIYTERYMDTPQHNPGGYDNATVSNVSALASNVRFLVMHGVADDNVHLQNSLTLLDKLDLAGVENYDFHAFPDSDHSIYFHNANPMVYGRLSSWLINAFNGEWLKTDKPRPMANVDGVAVKRR